MKFMKEVYVNIEKKLYERVSEITTTDYNVENNKVEVDNLLSMIEDLISEYDRIEEELEDIQNDMEENYQRIPVSNQYDVSDRDFI